MPLNMSIRKDRAERRGVFAKGATHAGRAKSMGSFTSVKEDNALDDQKASKDGVQLSSLSDSWPEKSRENSLYYIVRDANKVSRGTRVRIDLSTVYIPSALQACAQMFAGNETRRRCEVMVQVSRRRRWCSELNLLAFGSQVFDTPPEVLCLSQRS